MSRIMTGKLQLKPSDHNLTQILDTCIKSLRPSFEQKHIDLKIETVVYCPIYSDARRLAQVISNLLANSLKFTPSGGTVMVTLENEHDYGILSVADNGSGIEPELLPHIFEAFRQGEVGLSHEGLGLGLSIAKHIIEAHDGTIRAHSLGPNKGSTFTITLPLTTRAEHSLAKSSAG